MTPDLQYLTYTAILTAVLWIPYVISQVSANGFLEPVNYTDPEPRPVPLWGKRAYRAHLNAVEVFSAFAALVIVAHLTGCANAMTARWAMLFFWFRLAHFVVYMFGWPYIRTVIFTVGFVCIMGIAWEIVT